MLSIIALNCYSALYPVPRTDLVFGVGIGDQLLRATGTPGEASSESQGCPLRGLQGQALDPVSRRAATRATALTLAKASQRTSPEFRGGIVTLPGDRAGRAEPCASGGEGRGPDSAVDRGGPPCLSSTGTVRPARELLFGPPSLWPLVPQTQPLPTGFLPPSRTEHEACSFSKAIRSGVGPSLLCDSWQLMLELII